MRYRTSPGSDIRYVAVAGGVEYPGSTYEASFNSNTGGWSRIGFDCDAGAVEGLLVQTRERHWKELSGIRMPPPPTTKPAAK